MLLISCGNLPQLKQIRSLHSLACENFHQSIAQQKSYNCTWDAPLKSLGAISMFTSHASTPKIAMPQRPSIPIRSNNTPQSPHTPHNNSHSFAQPTKNSRQNKNTSSNKTYKTHKQLPPTNILKLQFHMLHELQLAHHPEAS